MTKSQIFLTIGGVLVVLMLFNLPKVVVDNEEEAISSSEEDIHTAETASDPEFLRSLNSLKDSLRITEDTKKSAIFADSLAEGYRKLNHFDSAAYVYEQLGSFDQEIVIKAGDAYYEAYTFAVEDSKRLDLANKAKRYYTQILDNDPDNLDAKTNLGMLMVGTDNPMQGVGLLREVLEKDPANFKALYNMGILSLQSNQTQRAIERFETLVQQYPESSESRFYLALSYLNAGREQEAKEQFEIVKKTDPNPEVQATVDSYLEDIE